ncbi:MAG TPA: hypothetical protein PLS53_01220 [Thermoanaerobaculaceae bacterium]|nr:hypothetical protein [Thermoanaerobaculaceae bacterium]
MDHVVDTNVLLVASAAHPFSPFGDSHVPVIEQRAVFDWLVAFRSDSGRRIVMDDMFKIYCEYRNKLTDQDYGLQVVIEKLQHPRFVPLKWNGDTAVVPHAFEHFDPPDRKFLAAVLVDPTTISLVNATDSDWLEIEAELGAVGVQVVHVIEGWLRASAGYPC